MKCVKLVTCTVVRVCMIVAVVCVSLCHHLSRLVCEMGDSIFFRFIPKTIVEFMSHVPLSWTHANIFGLRSSVHAFKELPSNTLEA